MAKLSPENTIDDEIDGRVEHLQDVAEFADPELHRVAGTDVVLPDHLSNPGRGVTQHEHEHDYDHDEGDVVVIVFSLTAQLQRLSPAESHFPVGYGECRVQHRHEEKRQNEAEDVVHNVEVDQLIEWISTHRCSHGLKNNRPVRSFLDYFRLKESGEIV